MSGKNGQLKESSTLTGGAREGRSRQKCKFDAARSTYRRGIKAEYQPESENSMMPAHENMTTSTRLFETASFISPSQRSREK